MYNKSVVVREVCCKYISANKHEHVNKRQLEILHVAYAWRENGDHVTNGISAYDKDKTNRYNYRRLRNAKKVRVPVRRILTNSIHALRSMTND